MKVYDRFVPCSRGGVLRPQIKISNKKLIKSGFDIGERYDIIYEKGKIIIQLKSTKG